MLFLLVLLLFSQLSLAAPCPFNRYEENNLEILQVNQDVPTDSGIQSQCLIKLEVTNRHGIPHRYYLFDSRGHLLIIDDSAKDQSMKSLKFHSLVFLPAMGLPKFIDSKIQLASGDQLLVDTKSGLIDWKASFAKGLTNIEATENELIGNPGDILSVHNYSKTWLNYGTHFGKPPESIADQQVDIFDRKIKCQALAKQFFINGDFRYQSWSEKRILSACP